MKTLGFVGTAKNTGKTTTALHILDLVNAAGIGAALTSIGYDGENTDHVTGLPKPRYFAGQGIIIATARRCLDFGTARYTDVQPTGLKTILGEIVIATVAEAGYVVLAGPNRKTDIHTLLGYLKSQAVELTMLDGALNRLAAMVLADGMVLSTGAAFDERVEVVASHAAAMESLFHYPQYNFADYTDARVVSYNSPNAQTCQLKISSVLEESALQQLAGWLTPEETGTCLIPGVFSPQLFQQLVVEHPARLGGKTFVFTSPLNLLAAGSPQTWQASFAHLDQLGARIAYLTPIPLHFLTVNPFYPQYLQKTGQYEAAYVDKHALLRQTRAAIRTTPVIDILQPPHPDLLALCSLKT